MSDDNSVLASAAMGVAAAEVKREVGGVPFVLVPNGYSIKSVEGYDPAPNRIRASFTAESLESFIAYAKKYGSTDSMIFVSALGPSVNAIIDYHATSASPSWCSHIANLDLAYDADFSAWREFSGTWCSQEQAAEFLEDHYQNIINPSWADVLEVAREIEVKKGVEFDSRVSLHSGSRKFSYTENVQGTVRKGQIEIPDMITLHVPVFRSTPDIKLEPQLKLRYRVGTDGLKLAFVMRRPDLIVDAAVRRILAELKTAELPVSIGTYANRGPTA